MLAALEEVTGKLTGRCKDRHGTAGFGDFLRTVAKARPRRRLYVVLDNCHTCKHAEIDGWNDRCHLHLDQDRRRDPAPRHP